MRFSSFAGIVSAALLAFAAPVLAHHPGTNLDEVMGDREKFFQVIDQPASGFDLVDAEGEAVSLADFADRIVVLNFIYAGCLDVCPLHSEKIAQIQDLLDQSPMKQMVQFVTVTTDPERDTPEILRTYGEAHGLDSSNWIFLTAPSGQPEDATRRIARAYGLEFTQTDDGQQMHGVVTHVIDRGGRLAAKFHGLRFEPVNMVLYLNGLINNASAAEPPAEKGWLEQLTDWF